MKGGVVVQISDSLIIAILAAALVAYGLLRASHRHAFQQEMRQREAGLFNRRRRGFHRVQG